MADEYPMTPEEYFQQQRDAAADAARRSAIIVSQPLTKTPDEYAQAARMAKSVNLPTAVIEPNFKTFAQKMTEKRNEMLLSTSPKLTEWVAKDDNYKIAADDVEGLSWFEGFGQGAWNTVKRAGARAGQMYDQFMLEQTAGRARDRNMTFGEILDSERKTIKGASGATAKTWVGPNELVGAFARWADARYADLIGTDDEAAARDFAGRVAESRKALAAIPKSEIATSFEREAMVDGAGPGDALANFGKAIVRNPVGALSWALETAGESVPQIAAAVGVTAATRNPTAGIMAMGAGSYATERYTAPADFLAEKGLDLSKQEDMTRLLSDPALMKEAQDRGVIRGAIIGAFDAASGGVAGKVLAGNPFVEAVAQGVSQAVLGSAGEAGARLAAGQELDWNDIIAEGIAEIATAPIDMGIAGREFVRNRDAAKRAEGTAAQAADLSSAASSSVLRARMPSSFQDFLDGALDGTKVESVYVPAREFTEYFQSQGIDPFELTDEFGMSRDDLDAAIAGGGDLRIPTSAYAAHIAGTDADAFFLDNMKFSPDEMSAREAAEFNEKAADAMQEAWEEAELIRVQEEALRGAEERIFDTMQSRLRQAGRTTDVANTEALIYPAFYRVMAERSGMTTDEFLARYPLPQVEGVRPEGMRTKDVTEFNRFLAEARSRKAPAKEKRGQSLLEFIDGYGGINDVGGELRSRDAQVVKRGKGKKNLRFARDTSGDGQTGMFGGIGANKNGADYVAQAAIEAGFMADDPLVLQYQEAMRNGGEVPDITPALWDAIDAELRGDAQYASEGNIEAVQRDEAIDQLEEYLASIGVSLEDDDASIMEAVRKDDEARRYGQGGSGLTSDDVRAWAAEVEERLDLKSFDVWLSRGDLKLNMLIVNRDAQSNGVGSQAMQELTAYADANGKRVILSPAQPDDRHGTTSRARLVKFYKRFGFVENKGRNKDFAISEGMYREPDPAGPSRLLFQSSPGNSLRIRPYSKEEMIARGADGFLSRGYERYIPINKLDGLEPVPANTRTEDGSYQPGEVIEQPIEVAYQTDNDAYMVYGGNHRIAQARANGQTYILAFVEPDGNNAGPSASRTNPDAGSSYQQDTGTGPRGSIQFPATLGDGDSIIRLSERADLSTFLHETGHYFLTVMQDMAGQDGAFYSEYETIKGWWRENASEVAKDARRAFPELAVTAEQVQAAIDTGTSGDAAIDQAIDVGMQEQWARAFEQYAMEGKAPSAELRGAFERFRAWLLSIYKRLSGLNVNVSDDLRRVFDRMLASDQEIANATQDAGGSSPLFATADEMGLTPEEFDRFVKLRGQAEDEAKGRLLAETMAPIRREREKWYREERATMRDAVEREVNAYRQYRAIEWMGNRRWLGEDKPVDMPDMRLSKKALVDRYGEGILKTLPRGKQTVYTVEGGIDPDEAAGWFGYGSGDEMLRAMEQAPARKEAIEAETDKRMMDIHGDVLRDGSVDEQALAAVHNDKRGEWLAAELKAVVEVANTGKSLTAKEARTVARQTIARMKVRDAMAANRFLAAERKAGQEVARLGAILAREGIWMGNARRRIATKARAALRDDGTVDAVAGQVERANSSTENYNETVAKLIDAKRRQLMNHALYSEARKVQEEVGKAERFVASLNKASKREKIAGAGRRDDAQIDYLGAIDDILDRYDFRRMSGRAEDRRGSLLAFVEAMRAAGRENELAIPDDVLANAQRTPYKTVPVEVLRGVIDSLKNLEHVALRWNKLIDAQKERDFNEAVGDVVSELEANVERRPPGRVGSRGERLRNSARQFFDLVLNATTLLREIDGFADQGGAYRNIKAPIDDAMNRLITRKQKAAGDLETLYSVYSAKERREMAVRKLVPALGYSLSKWELISIALNTGNEGNYQRLTDPRVRGSLTDDQVQSVLASLDVRDAKFVQSVWDYLETFRPDIAARERRTTGLEPAWVEARPVTIAGREMKGGYYPLRYDPRLSSLARDDQANDIAASLQAGRFGKAQTRNGHLQARSQSSGRDVELDMSVLHRHVNQVIYDLELSEPVSNSWRILQSAPVRDQFIQTGRQADFEALETWLKDVAEGQLGAADWVGKMARGVKSNFTAAKLAFNLSTVAMQVTGLAQTMVVVGKRDFLRGVQSSFRLGVTDEIASKSSFMSERQTTFNKDINDMFEDAKTGPVANRWVEGRNFIAGRLGFWLMTKIQWYTVDVPTWLAGYEQGLRKYGNDETRAVAHADDIVKRAQASGLFSDRSAIERGSVSRTARQNDVVRLFTTLGSYMFAKFNVAYERSAVASRTMREEGVSLRSAKEALSWTLDMAFLFTLEAVVTAAIKGGLPDDDDEDKDLAWAKFVASQTGFSVMGTIPFVRDAASMLQGFDGGGAYGSAIGTAVKGGKGLWNVLTAPLSEDGEIKRRDVKDIINGAGLGIGLPATQINRAVDAGWRQMEGEDVAPAEYLLGAPPKK